MNVYFDSSALIKRYLKKPGSEFVVELLRDAENAFLSRVGGVECMRAIGLAGTTAELDRFGQSRESFSFVELNHSIEDRASVLASIHGLCTLDAIHLASAKALRDDRLVFACWDRGLREAAISEGLVVHPESID